MADILLKQHTRSTGTIWYEVTNDGVSVFSTDSASKAKNYWANLVAEEESAEAGTVATLETHTIQYSQA